MIAWTIDKPAALLDWTSRKLDRQIRAAQKLNRRIDTFIRSPIPIMLVSTLEPP